MIVEREVLLDRDQVHPKITPFRLGVRSIHCCVNEFGGRGEADFTSDSISSLVKDLDGDRVIPDKYHATTAVRSVIGSIRPTGAYFPHDATEVFFSDVSFQKGTKNRPVRV